jgi:hypothetical protein
VSRLVPTIHPWIAITSGAKPHEPEFAIAAGSEKGMEGLIIGAKASAMTVVDLITNNNLREKISQEFQQNDENPDLES